MVGASGGWQLRERLAVAEPVTLDLSTAIVAPVRFVLQQRYTPGGLVDLSEPGILVGSTPWYREFAFALVGIDAQVVVYIVPLDADNDLLLAGLDNLVEPFFSLLSGVDFGDALTTLTARHWPDLYRLLVRGNSPTHEPMLCKVATVGATRWVVADFLRGDERIEASTDRVMTLAMTALEVVTRVTTFWTELPGLVDALAGPDRTSRRLSALAGIAGAVGDLGSGMGDGITVDELADLAQSARDLVENLLRLRD